MSVNLDLFLVSPYNLINLTKRRTEMIKEEDYSRRGWGLIPVFANALPQGLFEEMSSHKEAAGESSWGTRNMVYSFVVSMRPKTVLEIGSHIGSGAVVIGAALKQNNFGKCFSLEPASHYFSILTEFVDKAGLSEFVSPLQIFSTDPDLAKTIGENVDMIFLDANHSYSHVMKDLEISHKLLAPNGLIFLDDVGPEMSPKLDEEKRGGVRQALIDFAKSHNDLQVIFFEPPFWLNPCGLALVCKQSIR